MVFLILRVFLVLFFWSFNLTKDTARSLLKLIISIDLIVSVHRKFIQCLIFIAFKKLSRIIDSFADVYDSFADVILVNVLAPTFS